MTQLCYCVCDRCRLIHNDTAAAAASAAACQLAIITEPSVTLNDLELSCFASDSTIYALISY